MRRGAGARLSHRRGTAARAGVPAAIAAIGAGAAPETLRVMVGPWSTVRGDLATQSLTRGPRASGVYARFAAGAGTLTVLDQDGRPARVLRSGAGLIAATRHEEDAPVWVVTGTDGTGVDLAARAFTGAVLHDRFAVAVTAAETLPVPVPARVSQ